MTVLDCMRSTEYGWEVVCLEVDDDAEFDDCRAIKKIGYDVANSVKKESVDMTASKIRAELSDYYVESSGRQIPLQTSSADGKHYVRVLDEDASDDPLLQLPSCTEYKSRF